MKIETINKVYTLLKDIKLRCDKNIEFNPDKISREMKVSDNIFRTARKLGYFKKEGNKFICNIPEITREIAIECIETFNNSIKLSGKKNKINIPVNIPKETTPVKINKPKHNITIVKQDPVNHPEYYTIYSIEAIDMMILIFGKEKVKTFCELAAFQYRMRMGKKDGVDIKTDLAKEQWYLNKAKELV